MAAGLEARGGAREQWARAASITVPGPADLPFRSGEASYQAHQASALKNAVEGVCITNSSALWRDTTVPYHCGLFESEFRWAE